MEPVRMRMLLQAAAERRGGGQGPALSNVPRTSIDGPLIADN